MHFNTAHWNSDFESHLMCYRISSHDFKVIISWKLKDQTFYLNLGIFVRVASLWLQPLSSSALCSGKIIVFFLLPSFTLSFVVFYRVFLHPPCITYLLFVRKTNCMLFNEAISVIWFFFIAKQKKKIYRFVSSAPDYDHHCLSNSMQYITHLWVFSLATCVKWGSPAALSCC